VSSPSPSFFAAGFGGQAGNQLEVGSWKLEVGSGKLEAGSWKLKAGNWKLATGNSIFHIMYTLVCVLGAV
jgi:hypothetical protein